MKRDFVLGGLVAQRLEQATHKREYGFSPKWTQEESPVFTSCSSTFALSTKYLKWTKKDSKTGNQYQIAVSDCQTESAKTINLPNKILVRGVA